MSQIVKWMRAFHNLPDPALELGAVPNLALDDQAQTGGGVLGLAVRDLRHAHHGRVPVLRVRGTASK